MMKRFLTYHLDGYGYTRRGVSIPLTTGTYVHHGLALILAEDAPDGLTPALAAQSAAKLYAEEVGKKVDPTAEFNQQIMQEQQFLIQCLILGWHRTHYKELMDKFDVVAVEQEEMLKVADLEANGGMVEIMHMSRPDFILRDKKTKKLSNHDFKTASMINPNSVEEWRESIQMIIGTLAVEKRLGEEIPEYYMHMLVKGQRREFSKGSGTKYQMSSLCYAKLYPPNPPISTKWTFDLKGQWAGKQAVWEQFSPVEWVNMLPQAELDEMFPTFGPYQKNRYLGEQYLRALPNHEKWWIKTLWRLYEAQEKWGWETAKYQNFLDQLVPRNYDNCYNYGERCPMYDLCYKQPGWLMKDGYEPRVPHHDAELKQKELREAQDAGIL